MIKHTFAICAYKESIYLEECINSLINQKRKSKIIMCTSTPNEYIKSMAEKYEIPLFVNNGESGITQDWNFAYSKANTEYITIAHQDDVYDYNYSDYAVSLMEREKKPLIFFTDYYEIRNGQVVKKNKLLKIKRLMLLPMKFKPWWKSKFIRRRILSLGSPICCPSVTFAKSNITKVVFNNHFRTNEDWEAWEKISKIKGSFIYCSKSLTMHRIHEESETSAAIAESGRADEDYEMYRKFWPKCIVKILVKLYGTSEKSNQL